MHGGQIHSGPPGLGERKTRSGRHPTQAALLRQEWGARASQCRGCPRHWRPPQPARGQRRPLWSSQVCPPRPACRGCRTRRRRRGRLRRRWILRRAYPAAHAAPTRAPGRVVSGALATGPFLAATHATHLLVLGARARGEAEDASDAEAGAAGLWERGGSQPGWHRCEGRQMGAGGASGAGSHVDEEGEENIDG